MFKKLIFLALLFFINQSTECGKRKRTPSPCEIYGKALSLTRYRKQLKKEMKIRARRKNQDASANDASAKGNEVIEMEGISFESRYLF